MLNAFVRSKQARDAAERHYVALVRRAREPVFFARFDVPDTLDGRFDLLVLHAWALLGRIRPDDVLAQALVNRIFVGLDEALREMGAGDMGMGRRMKKFADAFYGRLKAYDDAGDGEGLRQALVRNLYRGTETPAAAVMSSYISRVRTRLAAAGEGDLDFGPLPDGAPTD
ncbi:ubiquinol-cytochrome C chaperone family protein [Rhizomicrobium electricum]|jgi:cytochrome b pre-mRNA-processing protein 3|uniref:Ubiquinol-cytochrome C chaperone family protein n=1 Tax=Rhizomicrobium electricum TaxID=480070 RepID=A0ABN1ENX9_9PROT|nr:ubiquinol-cytochrome C chaperone family protein [Rhizomicrobium electricum]NIJ48780.1 cytochrome b pre-mRNA-processing protein 3 [Rhizomicrobium electricum]